MLYSKEDINKIIPQKDPFLYVDEITEIIPLGDGRNTIKGLKTFTGKEEFFKGHFPGTPVVPGVLVLEAIAQCGSVYILSTPEYKGKTAFLAGADNVKWKRMVLPGDTLMLEVTSEKIRHGMGTAHGAAYIGEELVCQADLITFIR